MTHSEYTFFCCLYAFGNKYVSTSPRLLVWHVYICNVGLFSRLLYMFRWVSPNGSVTACTRATSVVNLGWPICHCWYILQSVCLVLFSYISYRCCLTNLAKETNEIFKICKDDECFPEFVKCWCKTLLWFNVKYWFNPTSNPIYVLTCLDVYFIVELQDQFLSQLNWKKVSLNLQRWFPCFLSRNPVNRSILDNACDSTKRTALRF